MFVILSIHLRCPYNFITPGYYGELLEMSEYRTGAFEESTLHAKLSVAGPDKQVSVNMLVHLPQKDERKRDDITLKNDVYVLGRSSKVDLTLESSELSRRHALLKREHGTFSITDLDSTNGTSVNGDMIDTIVLAIGDEITIGTSVM